MTEPSASATFCATLVDEWVGRGIRCAVVAPGSRSTPMAVALADRPEVAVHVVHDERAAGFVALGVGLDGMPAVLLCTSGTAAANFHPAVVEAGLSDVPMIVVTADRPPELVDVGAPQTIDQSHLYGRSVRWFHDPGVADMATASTWRSLAGRVVDAAADGPVHLNLPFREPLLGPVGALPPASKLAGPVRRAVSYDVSPEWSQLLAEPRGVILAGGRSGADVDDIARLADGTGWPVLADPMSGARHLDGAVAAFDAVLRNERFAAEHVPDVIVRIGRPAASKVLAHWVADSGATLVQVGGPGVIDPDHRVALRLDGAGLASLASGRDGGREARGGSAWSAEWCRAASNAEEAIDAVLADEAALTEPGVSRVVARHLPADAQLVVAASMPMRDLEWFGGPPARAHANRGANGIDGVVSTALGRALAGRPTVVLLGDIAFVHDAGALTALARRGIDLRVIVIDNDGGGIFSFLPQASALATERFEQLFGTPHGTDIVTLAAAHGLDAATVTTAGELVARLTAPGPSVTRIATDRPRNVALHAELNAAVVAAMA